MKGWERFLIGFMSSLLYPAIKVTQSQIDIKSLPGILGGILPFAFIGTIVGIYAFVIEKAETDRERLFKQCVTIPAFILGLAQGQGESQAVAQNFHTVRCSPINDFQKALLDSFSAITGNKRIRYYLLSEIERTNEALIYRKKRYFILGKFDKIPTGTIIYNVDTCEIE